jgi:hypothetical protein
MVYVDDLFLTNKFKFKVGFSTINENVILNEIALDQIDLFFNMLMDNCVIVAKSTYENSKFPIKNNLLMVHEKPNDQTVGSMIFLKLMNIVGNNLEINYVSISSSLGDNIKYTINETSSELAVLLPKREEWWGDKKVAFNPWWLRADTATYDKLINRNEIYNGDFVWEEMFKEEFEEANKSEKPVNEKKFQLIPGGKDVH